MALDILIVDDEADIRALIDGVLRDEGYETRVAGNSETALNLLNARRPNLVVLDIWLQGSAMDGMQLLDEIVATYTGVPVVMISGHGNIETAVAAIKNGAYDFIEKPFKADRLLLVIQRAIETAQLRREYEQLKLRSGGDVELIGQLPLDASIREQTDRGSPTVVSDPGAVAATAYRNAARRMTSTLALQGKDYSSKFPKIVVEDS